MIKLKDSRKYYASATGEVSTIVRQLGFAGVAVIWVFKNEAGGKQTVPYELLPAGVLLVIGLTLDLFQYLSKTLAWGIFNRWHESHLTSESKEIDAPRQINWSTNFFFVTKIIAIIAAYLYLIRFLFSQLFVRS